MKNTDKNFFDDEQNSDKPSVPAGLEHADNKDIVEYLFYPINLSFQIHF